MKHITFGRMLFFYFLIIYASLSYIFTFILEIYHNDAISRTALAFFTIFGRDPHLAAIGFVWQPLPSLLQIPLLLVLKPLGLMLLSGPFVTSLAGAFSTAIVYKTGRVLLDSEKKYMAVLVAILFGLNPMIILYSIVGTSEMIFMTCLLLSSYYLIRYFYRQDQAGLLLASLAMAASFWSRYEALPAFAGSIGVIGLHLLIHKSSFKKIESVILQYSLPFFYSVLIWILANWLIMKDPFYFMNSPYSNASFTTIFKNNPGLLGNSYQSVINSLVFGLDRIIFLAPVIFLTPLIGVYFIKKAHEKLEDLLLLGFLTFPYLAIIFFHAYQLYKGESFGWLRFFIYVIPLGTLLSFYFIRKNWALGVMTIILLGVGIFSSWYAINDSSLGREERSFALKLTNPAAEVDFSRTYLDQKRVAKEMDTLEGKVLIDTDKGFAVPIFSNDPNRYVITSDLDYLDIVKDFANQVDWVIVPQPASDDRGQNKIYEYYPKIWDGDVPSISLHQQIDGWKIYRVLKPFVTN